MNYILPVVQPPNSTTQRYAITTPVYSDGGFLITDAGNNVWEAQLFISPFLANFSIPFANNTRYTSQQIFGTINAALTAQIAAWGLPAVATLSLNFGFNPYRTNVTLTNAGTGSLSLGNYSPPSFSEKYLGIPITFPSVGSDQTLTGGSNAFTSIAGSNQLRWTPIA